MRYKIGTNTTHSIEELASQFNESPEQIKHNSDNKKSNFEI